MKRHAHHCMHRLVPVLVCLSASLAPRASEATPEEVILTEITTWSPQTVEVRNAGLDPVDLNGFQITGNAGVLLTIIGQPPILPEQHMTFPLPGDPLDLTGDAVGWLDAFTNPIELVAYGDQGPAPAPVFKPPFSLARTGGLANAPLAENWTVDPSHTLGFANDAPAPDLSGTEIVMNEWDVSSFTPMVPSPQRVELLNAGATTIGLSGYLLSNDLNSLVIPTAVLLPGDYLVVDVTDLGMGGTHPNLYLTRGDGVRIDQIGLADAPDDSTTIEALRTAGATLCAIPDGSGPHDGFDLLTSGLGVTRFACVPSLGGPNAAVPVTPTTWGRIKDAFTR